MSQHDFFSFPAAANSAENSPIHARFRPCGDMWCATANINSGDVCLLAAAPCDWTNAAWQRALQALADQHDCDVILLSQTGAQDIWSMAFNDCWTSLPPRLASLALRPHRQVGVVVRATDAACRMLEADFVSQPFAMWRCLIGSAKQGARFRWVIPEIGETFFKPLNPAARDDETWLPQLTLSPPARELDWLFRELDHASAGDLCGPIQSEADGTAVLAGLWLLHGDGDRSHRESQSIEDEGRHRCGNYWHGIMHRQEPDYGNSKYWFRRVGRHPVFGELAQRADALLASSRLACADRWRKRLGLPGAWDPFGFVDWCESAAHDADSRTLGLVRQIQFMELHLLLRASYRDAVGQSEPES